MLILFTRFDYKLVTVFISQILTLLQYRNLSLTFYNAMNISLKMGKGGVLDVCQSAIEHMKKNGKSVDPNISTEK